MIVLCCTTLFLFQEKKKSLVEMKQLRNNVINKLLLYAEPSRHKAGHRALQGSKGIASKQVDSTQYYQTSERAVLPSSAHWLYLNLMCSLKLRPRTAASGHTGLLYFSGQDARCQFTRTCCFHQSTNQAC